MRSYSLSQIPLFLAIMSNSLQVFPLPSITSTSLTSPLPFLHIALFFTHSLLPDSYAVPPLTPPSPPTPFPKHWSQIKLNTIHRWSFHLLPSGKSSSHSFTWCFFFFFSKPSIILPRRTSPLKYPAQTFGLEWNWVRGAALWTSSRIHHHSLDGPPVDEAPLCGGCQIRLLRC